MSFQDRSLSELTGTRVSVKVVDVGANPIDGAPPYARMLDRGEACVVGFEPNPTALAKLLTLKGPKDIYLQKALGDGEEHTLHICAAPGMTSLLEPDPDVLKLMHGFPLWGTVKATERVRTARLADIAAAEGADMLKIDIQGAELMVMKNAGRVLDDLVLIHTEVEFLPLYKNQPLFCDVHAFLRDNGFVFHRFEPLVSRMITPLGMGGNMYAGMSQTVWADAVFIRDFKVLEKLSSAKLISLAAILHDCYQALDVAMHVLCKIDEREGSALAQRYLEGLKRTAITNEPSAAA